MSSFEEEYDQKRPLKSCVRLLGRLLGQVIAKAHGQDLLDHVEHIRLLAKASRGDNPEKRTQLIRYLKELPEDKLVLVARAFNQFLNLANIAEQLYSTLNTDKDNDNSSETNLIDTGSIEEQLKKLKEANIPNSTAIKAINALHLDLVLTAHPTEITRRTLIEKQNRIYYCLHDLETHKLSHSEKESLTERLSQLIAQWWHTDELRNEKPTPVDEAVWGFAVIENSLWEAVPQYINQLSSTVQKSLNHQLPITFTPVQITSWMGGDRDGNPNVTAVVTEEVIRLARWKAADLFLQDINILLSELSMNVCSDALKKRIGINREPYRAVLKEVRTLLNNTLNHIDDLLKNREPTQHAIIENTGQLWEPLYACYESLIECGMDMIANGSLRNTLQRVKCFGSHLVRLDIRQESSRHMQVFAELTEYLSLGNYSEWEEQQRIDFLTAELDSKRPLFPRSWNPSVDVKEVLDTFSMLSQQHPEALGAYIISMAKATSDVLAVKLLLKEFNCAPLPVAPLFETLDDLNNAAGIMSALLSTPIYRQSIDDKQMIMIGYSDSAKDAGVMAASWAQYRAQEALLKVCKDAGVQPTLFHGRGGTTGRGGAPARAALLSQPPGSLENGLRVTEQGEMIRFKLGLPPKAVNTFNLYTSAMLQSNLIPPPAPQASWRDIVDEIAKISSEAYRDLVFRDKQFIDYFNAATPIQELSKLPLGSRPAKRKGGGGVSSLRAIPWSFAWSQNRLMLPAWYGAGEALEKLIERGQRKELESMCEHWPFFSTRISMLEMVFSKTDVDLAEYYDQQLVDLPLQALGEKLRTRLKTDIAITLSIANDENLLQDLPWLKYSLGLRNTYIDPLNLLQVELLSRDRKKSSDIVEKALMVTIGGIAAGLRNTG